MDGFSSRHSPSFVAWNGHLYSDFSCFNNYWLHALCLCSWLPFYCYQAHCFTISAVDYKLTYCCFRVYIIALCIAGKVCSPQFFLGPNEIYNQTNYLNDVRMDCSGDPGAILYDEDKRLLMCCSELW